MKALKKILLILLVLTLTLALFACGNKCKKHVDEDDDGKCDNCGKTFEKEAAQVMLFEDGFPTFQFVLASDLDNKVSKPILEYIENMEDFGLDILAVEDTAEDMQDCEILIGDVTSRGDKYKYDKHTLGKDGYIIKIVDGKIIVQGGSADSLQGAVEELIEDILMYDEDAEDMGTLYMEESQEVIEIQDGYSITAVKINGVEINGYTIATNTSSKPYRTAAENLQDMLYDKAGYWLEIVHTNNATDKSIVIKSIDKVYGDESFRIYTNDKNQLIIDCAFDNKLEDTVATFITSKITLAKDEVNFTGEIFKEDISFLTYEDFGAKGNGSTDDFEAIYKTHEEANRTGQTVKARDGAHYYIKSTEMIISGTKVISPAIIKTSTYWGDAKFTIDDRDLDTKWDSKNRTQATTHIFRVESDYSSYSITDEATLNKVISDGLRPGATKVDLNLGFPAMIIPYDGTHTVYRRRGYGGAQGSEMHEVIVLDKDGNIDESTPIMFDYLSLDKIVVYRLDIEPITIEGGAFTTRASRINTLVDNGNGTTSDYAGYIKRGLDVQRSFTTVKNVEHYVTDELTLDDQIDNGNIVKTGHPYYGFFVGNFANEIVFDGCVLTGRRCYTRPNNCTDSGTTGTYDLTGGNVNKLIFKNCIQKNFWVNIDENTSAITPAERSTSATPSMASYSWDGKSVKMHWGIGGTNFCKNMEYIGSTLSRFDAHSGLYNGKIIDSVVNYMALTGNGEFIVENTEWYSEGTGANSASMFHLRADYGSTWDGTITAKNLKAYVYTTGESYLFLHSYANWYYGYVSAMPNLTLDNLDIYDIKSFDPVRAGYQVKMLQNTVNSEPRMHLNTTKNNAGEYCYIDLDKDGFVDFTNIPYDASKKDDYSTGLSLGSDDPNNLKNLNPVKPPEYLKIINNDGVDGNDDGIPDGGYIFIVNNTYGAAPTVNPGEALPAGADENGGFFGATKFIYGTGENDYYMGTNHTGTQTFRFE